jgi:hypothetical protein
MELEFFILIIMWKSTSYEAPHYAIFFAASYYLIFLRSKYHPQHLVRRYRKFMAFLLMSYQVSHPYKTTGKVIDLYVLIFTYFALAQVAYPKNPPSSRPCTICRKKFHYLQQEVTSPDSTSRITPRPPSATPFSMILSRDAPCRGDKGPI